MYFKVFLVLHGVCSKLPALVRRLDLPHVQDWVVQPKLCERVAQHSGYLDLQMDSRLFFWFFGARSRTPSPQPLIVWLNGAPSSSALMGGNAGMFPCKLDGSENPTAWNINANVLFLDQFIDSGYSYGTGRKEVYFNNTRMIYAFLCKFLRKFPEYRSSPIHIFGDSFVGQLVLSLGELIVSMKKVSSINLHSVGLGNSLLDPLLQMDAQPALLCKLQPGAPCTALHQGVENCRPLFQKCYSMRDNKMCASARRCHWDLTVKPVLSAGWDIHDLRQPSHVNPRASAAATAAHFFNQEHVASELGARSQFMDDLDLDYFPEFIFDPRMALPSTDSLSSLLKSGIRVLLYAGDQDYIFNHRAIEKLTRHLVWPGAANFSSTLTSPLMELSTSRVVGEFRTFSLLSFVKIHNASGKVNNFLLTNKPASVR
ncbi:hypothetical protein DSO57_1019911 [Entomophthora muscae]|uniref:Uncharacterized protein n=1 Tax=Entomophthora muscae TaxID=34485 RepID=A0ACC2UDD2_9FUNG|nr:hypothetical protein DSO57_1019911 [Entomophthora muscae]